MSLPPFPYVRDGRYPPSPGMLQPVPNFCSRKHRPRCHQYYADIKDSPGFHTCPYGFASYTCTSGGLSITYTSLRVSGHVDRAKLKDLHLEHLPVLVTQAVERAANLWKDPSQLHQLAAAAQEQAQRNTKFINSTIHEIRRLNGLVKAESERLSRQVDPRRYDIDREEVEHCQRNIFQTSSLLSMRLDAYDFHSNPDRITAENSKPIPVYKKFDKVAQCFHVASLDKPNRIKLEGTSVLAVLGWNIFEMLPFVLLDNALKFSPPNESVRVIFKEGSGKLTVEVRSVGPQLMKGEEERIAESEYRGENAKLCSTGSGLGLALAKQICALHSIKMTFGSGPTFLTFKDVPHAEFTVQLVFDPSTLAWQSKDRLIY